MIQNNQLVYRKRSRDNLTIMEDDLRLCTVKPNFEIDRRYWREMGFSSVNEKAYKVPNSRLWIIDAKRARELRMATNVLTGPS